MESSELSVLRSTFGTLFRNSFHIEEKFHRMEDLIKQKDQKVKETEAATNSFQAVISEKGTIIAPHCIC